MPIHRRIGDSMSIETRKKTLTAILHDPDDLVRSSASRALDRVEGMERTAQIAADASKADKTGKIRAIHLLGQLDTTEAVDRMLAFLQDPEPDIRVAVTQAVQVKLPKRAFVPLAACLDDPDSSVVQSVLTTLSFFRDQRATEFILPFLDGPDPETAAVAAEALGRNQDPRAEEALTRILHGTGDHFLRARAAEALGNLLP